MNGPTIWLMVSLLANVVMGLRYGVLLVPIATGVTS